jgi:glycogen debranching enzyme
MEDVIQIKDQWYILATSPRAEDRTRVLKTEETFGLFDRFGDIQPIGIGEQGLYHEGTRYLSSFELTVNQRRPLLLNSSVAKDNVLLAVDLTTPDLYQDSELTIQKCSVHIFRSKLLRAGVCHEHIRVNNFGRKPVELVLDFLFDADFADIFEVRGVTRERNGQKSPAEYTDDTITLSYRGLDDVNRRTHIRLIPAPDKMEANRASYSLLLPVQQEKEIFIEINCQFNNVVFPRQEYQAALSENKNNGALAKAETASVHTDNEQFNDWLNRSATDLQMLTTRTEQGRYPYAGVPWFSTPFGRDGIITALQCLWVDPGLARGVLGFLAENQAKEVDAEQDAEPGKILHETRKGEMAALGEIPFKYYYGSVDATPLFVILAGAYFQRTGDRTFIERIWPNIKMALAWLDEYGDVDGDSFVEYSRHSSNGIIQQGWKDSNNSVFHQDGNLAQGPIALCEVQGYAYKAKRVGAELGALFGEKELAGKLNLQAENLKKNFNEAFWCDEIDTFALALDGKKNPCRVRSSNAGHVLFSEIATPEYARRAAKTILNQDSFSGWGVRTIPTIENRYNPMSYHNGSVWPHDNSIIAMGLANYGFKDEAIKILTGLFNAAIMFDLHRLPELFCGFAKLPGQAPTSYPVACSPQAWASGTVYYLLQACLGLTFSVEKPQLTFSYPQLPDYIDFVRISNLRVGNGVVDLALRRHTLDVGINVVRKEGDIDIAVIV